MSSVNSELTSAIREVMYHSQDMSPTEALQKVAEDRGLSIEKTARVAEAVNNLRVLHMYKTSADKSQDIDLADAATAIKQAHLTDKSPAALDKMASARQLDIHYSNGTDEFFLDARSAELRAPLFDQMLKQADLHDASVQHAPDYKSVSKLPKLCKKYAALQRLTADAEIVKQNTRDALELGLMKTAQDLKRLQGFDFQSFEKDAYRIHGMQIRPLITALAATNNWERLPAGEKIAHALVNDKSAEQKLLAGLMEKFAAYTTAFQVAKEATMANKIYEAAVVGQIKKAAEPVPEFDLNVAEKKWRDALSHEGNPRESYALRNREGQPILGQGGAPVYDIGRHESDIQRLTLGDKQKFEIKPDQKSGQKPEKKESKPINWPSPIKPAPGLLETLSGAIKGFGGLGDLIGPVVKKPALNAGKIRGIAQYAIQDDPILKARNPHAVVQAYKTMLTVSPTLAQDPNAAISFLRHATMGDTVSYIALQQLADTEKSMVQQKPPDRK